VRDYPPAMRAALLPLPPDRRARRGVQLMVGLVLFGVTIAMMVLGGLGLAPWDVLHQGLSRTFGLGIGTWSALISFVVLLGWWPLRERLGLGTLANAIVVGVVIDLVPWRFDPPSALWARVALLVGGVAGNGIGTVLYALAIGPITHRTIPALQAGGGLPAPGGAGAGAGPPRRRSVPRGGGPCGSGDGAGPR
jgi:uncharacterized membrane protein YczE